MHREKRTALGIKLPVIIIDSIKPNKKTSTQPYSGLVSKKSWILSKDIIIYFFAKNFSTALILSSEPNSFFIAAVSMDRDLARSSCIKDFNIALVSMIELSDCSLST